MGGKGRHCLPIILNMRTRTSSRTEYINCAESNSISTSIQTSTRTRHRHRHRHKARGRQRQGRNRCAAPAIRIYKYTLGARTEVCGTRHEYPYLRYLTLRLEYEGGKGRKEKKARCPSPKPPKTSDQVEKGGPPKQGNSLSPPAPGSLSLSLGVPSPFLAVAYLHCEYLTWHVLSMTRTEESGIWWYALAIIPRRGRSAINNTPSSLPVLSSSSCITN